MHSPSDSKPCLSFVKGKLVLRWSMPPKRLRKSSVLSVLMVTLVVYSIISFLHHLLFARLSQDNVKIETWSTSSFFAPGIHKFRCSFIGTSLQFTEVPSDKHLSVFLQGERDAFHLIMKAMVALLISGKNKEQHIYIYMRELGP